MNKLTGFAKGLIAVVIGAVIFGGWMYAKKSGLMDKIAPVSKEMASAGAVVKTSGGGGKLNRPIRVGINTWSGFAGIVYWNKGMKANTESKFYTNDGLQVEILQIDDIQSGKNSWIANKIDVWYCTVDSFPVDVGGIKSQQPKIILQTDWSRGGDAIVVAPGINTVADLKGKTVACAEGSPSHTFLLWMLKANEMLMTDIKLIKVANGIDAAAAFKAGKVDAAVCWSPDDLDCVDAIKGAKVLINTKKASNIIADAIYAKKSFIENYPKSVEALVKGWLEANAAINGSESAKTEATKLFATNFNVPEVVVDVRNARLCTYGDNMNFFEMNPAYAGVTGRSLYEEMSNEYGNIGLAGTDLPYWREIADVSILRGLSSVLTGPEQSAEGKATFAPVANADSLQTISSKKLSISFESGSAILDQNAQYVIQMGFGSFVKSFARSRIRIEGNTDSVGGDEVNQPLSERRAQAVANFLIKTYKLDSNRILVVGNGSKKPVASNDTSDGRAKNRRTDFEIVE